MTSDELGPLDAESLALISAARGAHDPLPHVRVAVRQRLRMSLAAGAGVTWYGALASAASAKLGVLSVALGLTAGGAWYATRTSPTATPLPTAKTANFPAISAAHVVEAMPPPPAASTPAAPKRRHPQPIAATTSGSLARETEALVAVNTALSRHDGEAALVLLNDYDRAFRAPVLYAERSAARVLTLCVLGQRAPALAEAARFVHRFPRSPLIERVRASCAGRALTP